MTGTVNRLPSYRIPLYRLLQAGLYMVMNRPRNIGDDFHYLAPRLPVTPVITGADRLPATGSYILVANHYERPGLWMGWPGMIMSRAVYEHTHRRLRLIAISEWKDYKVAGIPIPPPITRFIFSRFFDTFGFIAMEPEGADPHARAEGVRAALLAAKQGEGIGIFPEGNIGPTPAMIKTQAGSASFVLALSARGAPVLPTGLFEDAGRLHVVFGEPVELSDIRGLAKSHRDEAADRRIMGAVAALLPPDVRGFYSRTG
jgi:1-acyl-sn-glycerol-3-phosphate acyltransferase